LCLALPKADAAFVIKTSTATTSVDSVTTDNATTITTENHSTFLNRLESKFLPDRYRHNGANRDARLALTFGLWGLLFAPLGIAAIIFGARALKKHTRTPDVAIIGIVLGSLEVLFLIFFIIYFVAFAPFFYFY
jgi:hypothetical protein